MDPAAHSPEKNVLVANACVYHNGGGPPSRYADLELPRGCFAAGTRFAAGVRDAFVCEGVFCAKKYC